jgi:uncharacterized membrane protein YoaK (UPF0700 family)
MTASSGAPVAPPSIPLFDAAKARVGVLRVAASLAAAGGFLDAFTYVGHGHVFANAMTGNVVLLGINSLDRSWSQALRHLPPIGAFLVGVCVSTSLQVYARRYSLALPYRLVLVCEALVLFCLGLLPYTTPDAVFTVAIAFTASVQVSTFREVNGKGYSSTFTTGNLSTLGEAAFTWLFEGHSPKIAGIVKDFTTICLCFFVGVALGAYLTPRLGNYALWFDVVLFACIAFLTKPHKPGRIS